MTSSLARHRLWDWEHWDYVQAHVDEGYRGKLGRLFWTITSLAPFSILPERFRLAKELWFWCDESLGKYYYQHLPVVCFEDTASALPRYGLSEIAEKYSSGMTNRDDPAHLAEHESWVAAHRDEIQAAAVGLIANQRDCLTPEKIRPWKRVIKTGFRHYPDISGEPITIVEVENLDARFWQERRAMRLDRERSSGLFVMFDDPIPVEILLSPSPIFAALDEAIQYAERMTPGYIEWK